MKIAIAVVCPSATVKHVLTVFQV